MLVPMTATTVFLAVAALLVGAAAAWFLREREISALYAELASTRTRLEAERESFERERSGIEQKILAQFQDVAQSVLGNASTAFLDLASTKLGQERAAADGSLTTRVAEIKGVIEPVQAEFAKFSQAVSNLQTASAQDLGALKSSLSHVLEIQSQLREAVRTTNDATGQLRTALQNPRVAGNWGEISLDRIVELAGMTEHCDFERQTGVQSLDGSGERPDMFVNLTGGLRIPLDAKASVTNYIQAIAESNEGERTRLLEQSARDLKGRVTELRGRGYDRVPGYAGMTFLFVPNESMLSSALAREPGLIEEAARYRIVICSPLLLLCYLQAFANGWRIQKQQENAQEVAQRGKTLHERLQKFFISVGEIGKALDRTVDKFNDSVRKMDNVLVPGRELGRLLGLHGDLQPTSSIDTAVREVHFAEVEDASRELASSTGDERD